MMKEKLFYLLPCILSVKIFCHCPAACFDIQALIIAHILVY